MKKGWEYKKICEVGEVVGGTTPSTKNKDYWNGDLCWISPAELNGNHYLYDSRKKITQEAVNSKSLKLLPEGTVILSSRAPIGKVTINKVPTYCNQGFKCVICKDSLYNEYLYWWFYGHTEYLNSLGTGATFAEISKKIVENIVIPIPPYAEQRRIVSYLDSSFDLIDKIKENASKSLSEAKALFQSALAEAMEPKEGWEEKTLGEISTLVNNINWKKDVKSYNYIDLTSVDRYTSSITNTMLVNNENAPSRAKQIVKKGDILFATTRPTLKRVAIIDEHHDNDICSTGFCVIRPIKNSVLPKFVFYVLKNEDFYYYIEPLQTGASYPAVTNNIVKQYRCYIPTDIKVQQQIVSRLDSLSSKVRAIEEKYQKMIAECDAMKQAMLRAVFE